MERMWRKVNQGLTGKSSTSKYFHHHSIGGGGGSNTLNPSTDTASSAGFGDPQIVVAVSGQGCGGGLTSGSLCTINNISTTINPNNTSSNSNTTNNLPPNILIGTNNSSITGRRLASSGQQCSTGTIVSSNSFSQHVISTASSERRRRRRRKSRPKRNGDRGILKTSQPFQISGGGGVGGGGGGGNPDQPQISSSSATTNNPQNSGTTSNTAAAPTVAQQSSGSGGGSGGGGGGGDPSLRQRAVAKLRMFNFHLNWDLHMTQCKPCGPRSSGNILTRRLCRNRRRDDNELYRSNSFKFERFERKEGNNEQATDTLQKQISVCDDYSLPIDFVKKRPSSFDPCLAETIPDNWAAPSPLSEHVSFLDPPTIIHPIQTQPVKLVEGYSDPKDSKKSIKTHHRKSRKDKRSNYDSDSSAPKSSADEDNQSIKVPELNSPDSISEDLIRPLQSHKSPKKLTIGPDTCKRNPSPYYYSDLLKSKETSNNFNENKENKSRQRQSTASEPPQLTTSSLTGIPLPTYKKSVSLDVPEIEREVHHQQPKRYSITEDGVRIIRCNSPSTTTSDDSDCSECQKRREWHAKALALVRQTCNIAGIHQQHHLNNIISGGGGGGIGGAGGIGGLIGSFGIGICGGDNIDPNQHNNISMPPHRLLGPAVCACTAPAVGDDIDEFFRPRSIFYVHQQGAHECADCATTTNLASDKSNTELQDDDMSSGSRTRQIYETAFDCKVAPSDDDLDDVDRITNHAVLLQITNNGNNVNNPSGSGGGSSKQHQSQHQGSERVKSSSSKSGNRIEVKRLKNSKNQAIQDGSVSTLSQDLENIHIENNFDNINNANTTSTSQLPARGYTPSPPSTAPLPVKFPGKHDRFFMNSIKSAPNLPSSNPAHPRLKDLRLPIQSSIRHQQHEVPTGSDGSTLDTSYNAPTRNNHHRDRPRSVVLESGRVLELRRSHHHGRSGGGSGSGGRNYSSTESMATSSSGGSMESLRSSTSEGNRSTTSSESRHSTSLSSHSSDSGHSMAFPLRAPIALHAKLHILSPISDKSSQEPASETSEVNNRNNNSQKVSPEDATHKISTLTTTTGTTINQDEQIMIDSSSQQRQQKRRTLQNKTLLHLTDEMLGSDSGISLHSRGEDGKSHHQSAFHKFALPKLNFPPENVDSNIISSTGLPQDLRDLPFDMPKLRRRKVLLQQDICTSGSATSVDLGDLPFDMPKLRRRLRQPQTNLLIHSAESSGVSQASSSHSVRDDNKPGGMGESGLYRHNLTLNLNEAKPAAKFGSLELKGVSSKGLNLNLVGSGFGTSAVDLIDVSVPLERQGWYHGAITRVEAESTLRPLSEGSFLVRNCESTKQDYSLSLKSAKGFMHMRIQRNDSGQYILGQFSRPFESIPEMIRHFCLNRLPVRGAEHMCLLDPVIAQLL